MKLIAYGLGKPWPAIRPAPTTRSWLDKLPNAFGYRCLPLNIGSCHGWEVLCPVGFEVAWNGKDGLDALWVRVDRDIGWKPESHFGSGIVTLHTHHIFRTEPDFNLYITGPTNYRKDGIAPLTGVMETDWAPYTFTMNWGFTRPGLVRFEENEPFCLIFPVVRGMLDVVEPELKAVEAEPKIKEGFLAWSQSRNQFNKDLKNPGSPAVKEKWQKTYYRGLLPEGTPGTDSHEIKLQLKPFADKTKA
jgi:hypothetical protein